jgi:hypothetical protein
VSEEDANWAMDVFGERSGAMDPSGAFRAACRGAPEHGIALVIAFVDHQTNENLPQSFVADPRSESFCTTQFLRGQRIMRYLSDQFRVFVERY